MKVTHLYSYPIKSLAPVSLPEIEIWQLGLQGDREMMLVDTHGVFITQRTRTELTRFKVWVSPQGVRVNDKITHAEFTVKPADFTGRLDKVQIWEDEVVHTSVNHAASKWFSEILGEPVSLVKINSEYPRYTDAKHNTPFSKITSFADSLPILLCGSASFKAVEADYGVYNWLRFRPNIIVDTERAFEEDFWDTISFGEVALQHKKRCARCNLIMVDPETGEIDKKFLSQLSQYRTHQNKVYFGIQIVPIQGGTLRVGDAVSVTIKK